MSKEVFEVKERYTVISKAPLVGDKSGVKFPENSVITDPEKHFNNWNSKLKFFRKAGHIK